MQGSFRRWAGWAVPVVLLCAGWAGAAEEKLQIEVLEAAVREKPSTLSAILGKLTRGTEVRSLEKQGTSWHRIAPVSGQGPAGWVRSEALTSRKITLSASGAPVGTSVSDKDLSNAAKGLNPQMENDYKKANPNLAARFDEVDRIENSGAWPVYGLAELKQFLAEGQLNSEGQ